MAYTNTPEISTYKTERFFFVGTPQQRDGVTTTKDQRFVNVFPEQLKSTIGNEKKYFLRQRGGTSVVKAAVGTGASRGLIYWNGSILTTIGSGLYKDGVLLQTLSTSTGLVGFTEFNGTYDCMVVLDGTSGWVIKTDWTVTQITNANFPTPHITTPVFMDGYLFVAKAGTADIYNSDLEDPLAWTAGSFYTAEMYPDKVVAIAKAKNYLVAIGEKSAEFLYDAAQPTGSPLGRNDSVVQFVGTPAQGSVVSNAGILLYIGDTDSGGRTIWMVKDFKASEVGIEPVKQSLSAEGTAISSATAFMVHTAGHRFYVINLTNRSWVLDLDENMWHEWSYETDQKGFHCKFSCNGPSGEPYMLTDQTEVVTFNYDQTVDRGVVAVPITLITTKYDFGTINRKFCYRLTVVGDDPDSADSTTVQVSWSDDDYKTWSGARTIYINTQLPSTTQLGFFRRRAFKITANGTGKPLRLEGFEVDVNVGGT